MSDVDQHTTTDATDHELAKQQIAMTLTNQARGKANAISSTDLAARTPVAASTVRDLIAEVRREFRLPIGSANGYFIITDEEEFSRQVERQKRQAETSRQTARDIAAAWNRGGGGE
jgi:hypothetical protein